MKSNSRSCSGSFYDDLTLSLFLHIYVQFQIILDSAFSDLMKLLSSAHESLKNMYSRSETLGDYLGLRMTHKIMDYISASTECLSMHTMGYVCTELI